MMPFRKSIPWASPDPCTKHNYLVKRTEDLARIIKEAFLIASSGRPGPVLIDIPKECGRQLPSITRHPQKFKLKSYKPTYSPNVKQLNNAVADMIKDSQKTAYFCRRWGYTFKSFQRAYGTSPVKPKFP